VEELGTSVVPKNRQRRPCPTVSLKLSRITQQLLLRLPGLPGLVPPITVPRRSLQPSRAAPYRKRGSPTLITEVTLCHLQGERSGSPATRYAIPSNSSELCQFDHASIVQTTTSGRGGIGNAHDHVLEKGIFERVIAHEDVVIRQHREMRALKTSRTTGRGGAGNIKRSKKEELKKDTCEYRSNILILSSPLVLYSTDNDFYQRPPCGRAARVSSPEG
jgi:Protein of unknown function (DUF3602)